MARINNDNQENINNIKNQVESYYNNYASPYFMINYDDCDEDNYEIEQYDDLQNQIQEIYDNPQDYTKYKNIWVEYWWGYWANSDNLGYIKGGEE